MIDSPEANLFSLAEADLSLDIGLKHILKNPHVVIPKGVSDPQVYIAKRTAELYDLQQKDPVSHQAVIDSKGELWQVAYLQLLGKEGKLRNFLLRLDSDRISVMVEPLFPGRLIQFKVTGDGIHSAPFLN